MHLLFGFQHHNYRNSLHGTNNDTIIYNTNRNNYPSDNHAWNYNTIKYVHLIFDSGFLVVVVSCVVMGTIWSFSYSSTIFYTWVTTEVLVHCYREIKVLFFLIRGGNHLNLEVWEKQHFLKIPIFQCYTHTHTQKNLQSLDRESVFYCYRIKW